MPGTPGWHGWIVGDSVLCPVCWTLRSPGRVHILPLCLQPADCRALSTPPNPPGPPHRAFFHPRADHTTNRPVGQIADVTDAVVGTARRHSSRTTCPWTCGARLTLLLSCGLAVLPSRRADLPRRPLCLSGAPHCWHRARETDAGSWWPRSRAHSCGCAAFLSHARPYIKARRRFTGGSCQAVTRPTSATSMQSPDNVLAPIGRLTSNSELLWGSHFQSIALVQRCVVVVEAAALPCAPSRQLPYISDGCHITHTRPKTKTDASFGQATITTAVDTAMASPAVSHPAGAFLLSSEFTS